MDALDDLDTVTLELEDLIQEDESNSEKASSLKTPYPSNRTITDSNSGIHILPSGNILDLKRPRSWGRLNSEELEYCKSHNIPIGYDTAQTGWVTMQCDDDLLLLPISTAFAHSALKTELEDKLRDIFSRAIQSLSKQERFLKICEQINELAISKHNDDIQEADSDYLTNLSKAMQSYLPNIKHTTDNAFSYRPWRKEDAGEYLKILSNPKVWEYLPDNIPASIDETMAKDLIEAANLSDHHQVEAIVYEGNIIGQMRWIFDNYKSVQSAELTYLLAEEYWGKGLMSRILPDYIHKSFLKLKLDIAYLWIQNNHQASIKCAESSGFYRDGFSKETALADQKRRSGSIRFVLNNPK